MPKRIVSGNFQILPEQKALELPAKILHRECHPVGISAGNDQLGAYHLHRIVKCRVNLLHHLCGLGSPGLPDQNLVCGRLRAAPHHLGLVAGQRLYALLQLQCCPSCVRAGYNDILVGHQLRKADVSRYRKPQLLRNRHCPAGGVYKQGAEFLCRRRNRQGVQSVQADLVPHSLNDEIPGHFEQLLGQLRHPVGRPEQNFMRALGVVVLNHAQTHPRGVLNAAGKRIANVIHISVRLRGNDDIIGDSVGHNIQRRNRGMLARRALLIRLLASRTGAKQNCSY